MKPVISLGTQSFETLRQNNSFYVDKTLLIPAFRRKTIDMDDVDATLALHQLSLYLSRYYGEKVIILLDEYDTPLQEAYVNGYWEQMILMALPLRARKC